MPQDTVFRIVGVETLEQRFIATIDQGTTGTRCAIFDNDGKIITLSYREHKQIYPRLGWVEHDPSEIWQQTKGVIEDALQNSKIEPRELAALAL
ncbi:MAG: glycerol kinase [Thermoproteota archaeon]|nr:glycerol kinase [Thermoproteota archaeon]